jgi:hypothetical protein
MNNKPALLIRFTFRTNHINSLNIFNQVGLISLAIFGDRMGETDKNR